HRAFFHIPPIENATQIYSNAGIAKSYDYDSVVIGSSMTENFTPSQLDRELGGHFIKLPVNAGSPFNHKQMMDMAFAAQDIERIFYGVDIALFTYFYKTPKCEMPEYLYDDDLFNDTAYWFNKNVLSTYIPMCLKTLGQSDPDQRDTMYTWGDMYEYSREAAFLGTTITDEVIPQRDEGAPIALAQQTKLNVEHNVLAFVKAHPDTEFILFFPPYSLVRWYRFYREGEMEYHLTQKAAFVEALLPYENVKIYDFQAKTDWILELENYIDSSHYGPWINHAMVELVAQDQYRITSLEETLRNNEVIRDHIHYLVSCGEWPEDFSPVSAH
ncbi:MAG: hypothetical protein IJ337_03020, partial [Clostridia bacterium]|nr:hypothetical protein [Clostridia bacterium]